MLPATLHFLIALTVRAINERMARGIEYLREEVRVFREALVGASGHMRMALSAEQRRRLALKGKQLTAEERRACCQIVRRETILARSRHAAAHKCDSTKVRKPGRPRKVTEIRQLVVDLAGDNHRATTTRRSARSDAGRALAACSIITSTTPRKTRRRSFGQDEDTPALGVN
jgi:hypothetical protein